ncbi:uncharacterized protein LOC6569823 [Drosophila grimshawi]|uniref:GH14165 n=1 Tax=Drosophila grimshawi TaxID=7222 RepID=B4JXT2_DROGR|nr:uncharacterized protein LOC6569823 [Drosophila grimshawi]EDV90494.1 GH14165 [Drosophila grimshawi]
MPAPQKSTFFSRNLVAIVMVPSLIGIHFGWKMLQENRTLVAADEQIDLPPITLAKFAWKRLTNNLNNQTQVVEKENGSPK